VRAGEQELEIWENNANGRNCVSNAAAMVHIYTPSVSQLGGPRLSLTVAILEKGRFFSGLRLKAFVHVAVWIRCYNKLILWGATIGAFVFWRSSKTWLTMFPKYNLCTGTFGLGMKLYTVWKAWAERRLNQSKATHREASARQRKMGLT
jgi:hypothetical protein